MRLSPEPRGFGQISDFRHFVKWRFDEMLTVEIGKRGKIRGGVILRFTGLRESDSFLECRRSRILNVSRTPN